MFFAGMMMVVLGVVAILFPLLAGLSAELFYGSLLIAFAIIHLSGTGRSSLYASFGHTIPAVIFLAMGLLLVLFPVIGLFSMALITGAGFFVQGIIQLAFMASTAARRERLTVGVSGVVGILAGGAILYAWPFDSAWVFGGLLAVNLIFMGLTVLRLSCGAERPRQRDIS